MLNGIDISNHQTWSGIYNSYEFIIMKASEGIGFKDAKLDEFYNKINGSDDGTPNPNKYYGFYHYARPESGNDAVKEADWFLSLVSHHAGYALFVLDWEGEATSCDPAWAKKWMDRVYEKTGVKPLIYMSQAEANDIKYKQIRDADYGLWVAHWTGEAGSFGSTIWDTVALHQWQGSPLDKDCFMGDRDAWRKYCQTNKKQTSSNSSSKKTYFKKADPNETSIVDFIKECGVKTVNFEYQTKVAKANGINNYTGTYDQNVKLLKLAYKGKLIKP